MSGTVKWDFESLWLLGVWKTKRDKLFQNLNGSTIPKTRFFVLACSFVLMLGFGTFSSEIWVSHRVQPLSGETKQCHFLFLVLSACFVETALSPSQFLWQWAVPCSLFCHLSLCMFFPFFTVLTPSFCVVSGTERNWLQFSSAVLFSSIFEQFSQAVSVLENSFGCSIREKCVTHMQWRSKCKICLSGSLKCFSKLLKLI